jgi:PKD repeat protein
MKTYQYTPVCLILMSLIFPLVSNAQIEKFCGSSEARERAIKEHPEILQQETNLERFTRQYIASHPGGRNNARSGPIIIPIVFHILHEGGPENISDAQVIDQVRILNRDYNKQNADTANAVGNFKSIIADIGIQFRLANIDPWGNCTNGIDRINSDQTYVGDDYSKLNSWPREKYLNVWVVKSMMNGVAGYAYYPSSVATVYSTPAMDGVIILSQYIGSIGTSSVYTSRALTHEIGHYLNLEHPWGNNNSPGQACGDDDVDDTPITKGWTNCPTASTSQICHPGVIENYQNYMDYSYCSIMFTEGQKARMMAALASNVSDRNNLYSDANLAATGTADTARTPCAPVAGFVATKKYTCTGTAVTFNSTPGNGSVDSYYWEFPNGTPSVSTDANPSVTFNSTGLQPVSLTVTNSYGVSTKKDTFQIVVGNSNPLYQAPFFEGFEDPNILSTDWSTVNYDNNNTSFKQVNFTSCNGTGCLQLNNYTAHANQDIDEIVSPGFDLTQLTSTQMKLSFDYSLATSNQYFSDLKDSLVVYASANCGSTWSNIYSIGGTKAVNAGYWVGNFVPTQAPAFWKHVNINLAPAWKQGNVRFKFQVFSAVRGNNFYIDDINLGLSPLGVEDMSVVSNMNLFPNPTNGDAILSLDLEKAGNVSVKVYDMTGKESLNVTSEWMNEGENRVSINSSALATGVYIVSVKAGDTVLQKKLIIQ